MTALLSMVFLATAHAQDSAAAAAPAQSQPLSSACAADLDGDGATDRAMLMIEGNLVGVLVAGKQRISLLAPLEATGPTTGMFLLCSAGAMEVHQDSIARDGAVSPVPFTAEKAKVPLARWIWKGGEFHVEKASPTLIYYATDPSDFLPVQATCTGDVDANGFDEEVFLVSPQARSRILIFAVDATSFRVVEDAPLWPQFTATKVACGRGFVTAGPEKGYQYRWNWEGTRWGLDDSGGE